ncbi:acyl-[acyl-carrier-protein]--UDP-N-acetylglucosamine O-acyltransferase [Thiocapsa imhoffii]|uniref:Acyl-[acyl-carrier-protein]--UDP-N-acetylglucosamine O-acyltransferase n=1 Tax=Thiocapsa imhoffii TaxID=382777 RepID=A0A9X0WGR9_9GAMM|nr:acyl-ACP--UDP-N-acetylglucosamine O-acyltransferase [Thiocapsa imhoffii]MBK1644382.1 acyl-[acyl-carrier-protein]--UDP-N-acetylglucosamine O-acyltransferase [Thiocapsa imhoffii]
MIHPTALVDAGAVLGEEVEVGPYAIIGADVEIGARTRIGSHAVIKGPTRLGSDNRVFQFASIGEDPQDRKYGGEVTRLDIGDRNQIREFVTLHRGTLQDQGVTRIGDDNLFMAYVHVAHDCRIGNHVIMSNAASLGGHVRIQDHAILGGFTIVHQFCRIGCHAFTAMGSVLSKDVPPYVMVGGHPAEPRGINAEGLRRSGFSSETIQAIKRAYRSLYLGNRSLAEALDELTRMAEQTHEIERLVEFIHSSQRSIVR